MNPGFVTTKEAADYLKLSERKVRLLIAGEGTLSQPVNPEIPSYKFGASRRIRWQDLEAYTAGCLQETTA